MSPTSYQAAPPRIKKLNNLSARNSPSEQLVPCPGGRVKPLTRDDFTCRYADHGSLWRGVALGAELDEREVTAGIENARDLHLGRNPHGLRVEANRDDRGAADGDETAGVEDRAF